MFRCETVSFREGTYLEIRLVVQKSCDHQLEVGSLSNYLQGFYTSQVVGLGISSINSTMIPPKVSGLIFVGGGVEKSRLFEMMVFFWPEFNCDTTRENINSLSFCGVARADAVSSPHHVPLVDAEMTKLSHSTMISEVA